MQMTLFYADVVGKAANCAYPYKVVIADTDALKRAITQDHVCATPESVNLTSKYKGRFVLPHR